MPFCHWGMSLSSGIGSIFMGRLAVDSVSLFRDILEPSLCFVKLIEDALDDLLSTILIGESGCFNALTLWSVIKPGVTGSDASETFLGLCC